MVPPRTIERLAPDRRSADAVHLIVGGRVLLTIPVEVARAEGVAVGVELGDSLLERLTAAADRLAAFRTALRLLERRPYARRDLGRRLRLKGHQAVPVEAALDRAAEGGLLDDEGFARHYVQTRSSRGRGPVRLRRELAAQGVAQAVVERVLAAEITPADSEAAARSLAQKRLHQLRHLERPDRIRRVVAFLARRGYAGAEVRRMVRESS